MEPEYSLSSYRIFNTVAESGNLSAAAKELYISQPAISRAVSKLEESLSVKLFIRNSRGVRLTEEGAMLYEHTRSAFRTLRQGESSLKHRKRGELHLSVGSGSFLCEPLLLPYIRSFLVSHPNTSFRISCHSVCETIDLVDRGEIDIGLVDNVKLPSGCSFFPLLTSCETTVISKNLLKKLAPLSGEALLSQTTLFLPQERNQWVTQLEDYLFHNRIDTQQIQRTDTTDLLIAFAKSGLGISLVTKDFVKQELSEGSLVEIPLVKKLPARVFGFLTLTKNTEKDAIRTFLQ